jgi:hypothetical protein
MIRKDTEDGRPTRRRLLGVLSTTMVAALAGCSGDSGDSDGDDTAGTPDDGSSGSGGTGGASECPSLPVSYTRVQTSEEPRYSFEAPTEADMSDENGEFSGNVYSATDERVLIGSFWSVTVISQETGEDTIDAAIEEDPVYTGSNLTEVTDEFDLSVGSDARLYEDPVAEGRYVMYVPTADDVLNVNIRASTAPEQTPCEESARAILRHAVETFQLE